jgi:hypothetical protein
MRRFDRRKAPYIIDTDSMFKANPQQDHCPGEKFEKQSRKNHKVPAQPPGLPTWGCMGIVHVS